jgi:autotransporter-associated beta strand protein
VGSGSIINNGSGTLTFSNGTFNEALGAATVARTLTLGGNYDGSSGDNEIQGTIQNNATAGAVGLTVSGSVWKLSGANTYTGATTVNGGTLKLGAANAIASGSAVTVNSTTAGATATFNLNGFGVTVPGLTFGGTGATATSTSQVIGTGAGSILTLNGNATYTDTNNPLGATISTTTLDLNNGTRTFTIGDSTSTTAELSVSSTIQNGSLTKAGAGTMVLSGTNSYTGATGVTAGVLVVNGLLANTTTTVSGTGTLKGSGSIAGSVTINSGGTLDSGTSIESLATGALSFTNLATFQYELDKDALATVAGDLTAVTGNLSLSDTVTLSLVESGSGAWELGTPLGDPLGSPAADKLTLIGYTGSWNGGLFTYLGSPVLDDSAITLNGQEWLFNYNDTLPGTNFTGDLLGGMTYVTMTVPEPSAALLGGLGLLALLRRRR